MLRTEYRERLVIAVVCRCSERDLLGDYDFNPFIDEELDYDEDMEDLPPADSAAVPNAKEEGEEEEEPDKEDQSKQVCCCIDVTCGYVFVALCVSLLVAAYICVCFLLHCVSVYYISLL